MCGRIFQVEHLSLAYPGPRRQRRHLVLRDDDISTAATHLTPAHQLRRYLLA